MSPDVIALNEVSIPKFLYDGRNRRYRHSVRVGSADPGQWLSMVAGKALTDQFKSSKPAIIRPLTFVALVARVLTEESPSISRNAALRVAWQRSPASLQVQQLMVWTDSRADVSPSIVYSHFRATLDADSAGLMGTRFRPTQTAPNLYSACELATARCSIASRGWIVASTASGSPTGPRSPKARSVSGAPNEPTNPLGHSL